MGSGHSRLHNSGSDGEKTRSTFLSRIYDFRKRRNGDAGTLSKKQLLKDAIEEEDGTTSQSSSSHETEKADKDNKVNIMTKEIIQVQPNKSEETVVQVAITITTEKISRVVPIIISDQCETKEEVKDSIKDINVEKIDHNHKDIDLNQDNKLLQADDEKIKDHVEQINKDIDLNEDKLVQADEKIKDHVEQINKDIDLNQDKVVHVDENIKDDHVEQVNKDINLNQEKVIHDDEKINDLVEQVNKEIIDLNQDKEVVADEKVEEEIKSTQEGNTAEPVEEVIVKPEIEQQVTAKSDDSDSDDEEYGRLTCPGSPSFRIYCIEADQRKEQRKEEEESKSPSPTIVMKHQKSYGNESVASSASRSSRISNEVREVVEVEPSTKRKGSRKKKFGAVKTLMRVKSCYHPMFTCTGDERTRLIVPKAAN